MAGNNIPNGTKRISLNLPMDLYEFINESGESYESFTTKIMKFLKEYREKPYLKRMFQIMDGAMKWDKNQPTPDILDFIDEIMEILNMKESES